VTDAILVLNAGSSSIKFSLFPGDEQPMRQDLICEGELEGIGHQVHFTVKDGKGAVLNKEQLSECKNHEDALAVLLQWLRATFPHGELIAAGHRVVHGGSVYTGPVRIDNTVIAGLRRLIPLAPLHEPYHLAGIEALAKLNPSLPQFACFDTCFHHTQPEVASTFALPRRLTEEGVRRYGFHGSSYEYVASVLPDMVGPEAADGRVVVAHLGNGASMCAMLKRKSVATTMSFTALDGLPMGQRCGNLDPAVVLYLIEEKGMGAKAISDLLWHESGLLGVSGISNDMRTLHASNEPHAKEAIDLFVYRICRELGSLAAALGGVDVLVFTAGIGEHDVEVRRLVCERAAWLGFEIDHAANSWGGPQITKAGGKASAWVIPTDEDLMIARHSWALLQQHPNT
jgi:acetate kinase